MAILKNEEKFLPEWIIYHRMLGFDHFYLYDDNPDFPLEELAKPFGEYVMVVNWGGSDHGVEGSCNQIRAYNHAIMNYGSLYDWVVFIDGDEFVVLRKHENIKDFLNEFRPEHTSVALNWHVFGHNGYYDDPEGLIVTSLTRRMKSPNNNIKSFTRPEAIKEIDLVHFVRLKHGCRVDANKRMQVYGLLYKGLTDKAVINHYQCRSFTSWMNRPKRGCAVTNKEDAPKEHEWRHTEEGYLTQFVKTIARRNNEYIDMYMFKYKEFLEQKAGELEAWRRERYERR